MLTLKLHHTFEDTYVCRRLTFAGRPTWDELSTKVVELFFIPLEDVSLAYYEGDGNQMIMSSQEELEGYFLHHFHPQYHNWLGVFDLHELRQSVLSRRRSRFPIESQSVNDAFVDRVPVHRSPVASPTPRIFSSASQIVPFTEHPMYSEGTRLSPVTEESLVGNRERSPYAPPLEMTPTPDILPELMRSPIPTAEETSEVYHEIPPQVCPCPASVKSLHTHTPSPPRSFSPLSPALSAFAHIPNSPQRSEARSTSPPNQEVLPPALITALLKRFTDIANRAARETDVIALEMRLLPALGQVKTALDQLEDKIRLQSPTHT